MAVKSVLVEVSPGEMIDKITILEIKSERIDDDGKLANVRAELGILSAARGEKIPDSPELTALTAELKTVNERLWEIEDDIRDCERANDFGARFVELARSVYLNNDERAAIKAKINALLGAEIVEEKSYRPYR
jgi:hypothetical protein